MLEGYNPISSRLKNDTRLVVIESGQAWSRDACFVSVKMGNVGTKTALFVTGNGLWSPTLHDSIFLEQSTSIESVNMQRHDRGAVFRAYKRCGKAVQPIRWNSIAFRLIKDIKLEIHEFHRDKEGVSTLCRQLSNDYIPVHF